MSQCRTALHSRSSRQAPKHGFLSLTARASPREFAEKNAARLVGRGARTVTNFLTQPTYATSDANAICSSRTLRFRKSPIRLQTNLMKIAQPTKPKIRRFCRLFRGNFCLSEPSIVRLSHILRPISNLQSPISNFQSPISNLQSPISNLQFPISNLQPLISNLQFS